MAIRKRVPVSMSSAPYMKSPLQLEQWAAYEAITAKRAQEAAQVQQTKFDASKLMAQAHDWKTAESIRSFVAATLANVPRDADGSTPEAARLWEASALGVADELDQTKTVAALLSVVSASKL